MAIQQRIVGQARDLGGGFVVQRLLPSALRQAVGPFLFMDHFGPVTVLPDAWDRYRATAWMQALDDREERR